jgi:hypothetical protein
VRADSLSLLSSFLICASRVHAPRSAAAASSVFSTPLPFLSLPSFPFSVLPPRPSLSPPPPCPVPFAASLSCLSLPPCGMVGRNRVSGASPLHYTGHGASAGGSAPTSKC